MRKRLLVVLAAMTALMSLAVPAQAQEADASIEGRGYIWAKGSGVAILDVAYRIVGRLVFNCDYHLTFPIHLTTSCSTTRDVIWTASVAAQAISRNTKELVWYLGYIVGGPMTRQFFHESAAYLAAVISEGERR